jgi:hypothetical protein
MEVHAALSHQQPDNFNPCHRPVFNQTDHHLNMAKHGRIDLMGIGTGMLFFCVASVPAAIIVLLLLYLSLIGLIIPPAPLVAAGFTMRIPATERTSEVIAVSISRIGDKKDLAMFAFFKV